MIINVGQELSNSDFCVILKKMVAVQYALQIAGMIFQTRSKSRVNSNKIADSGVMDHEVWKDKNRRRISGFYQTYDDKQSSM